MQTLKWFNKTLLLYLLATLGESNLNYLISLGSRRYKYWGFKGKGIEDMRIEIKSSKTHIINKLKN